jgi:hypothetical protein
MQPAGRSSPFLLGVTREPGGRRRTPIELITPIYRDEVRFAALHGSLDVNSQFL